MDRIQHAPPAYISALSFVIAFLSVGLTTLTTLRTPPTAPPPIAIFNILTQQGLSATTPRRLDADPASNRTLWEAVDSAELHAGLQRVEVGAWIPPHSHATEELIVVYAGTGRVSTSDGGSERMEAGAMVHVRAHEPHAFRNVGREPLLLMWMFPKRADADNFRFRQEYPR